MVLLNISNNPNNLTPVSIWNKIDFELESMVNWDKPFDDEGTSRSDRSLGEFV